MKSIPNFTSSYWKQMYAKEKGVVIDGQDNSKEYANYLHSILQISDIEVDSIVDIGCGKGTLIESIIKKFKPKRSLALEPSEFIFNKLVLNKFLNSKNVSFKNIGIQDYSFKQKFSLGICNSVFQYIPDEEVKPTFEKLASSIKYLYFTVPTIVDYIEMKKAINFEDPFSFKRSKDFYMQQLEPYFRLVSMNLLESKIQIKDTNFCFELFRF